MMIPSDENDDEEEEEEISKKEQDFINEKVLGYKKEFVEDEDIMDGDEMMKKMEEEER